VYPMAFYFIYFIYLSGCRPTCCFYPAQVATDLSAPLIRDYDTLLLLNLQHQEREIIVELGLVSSQCEVNVMRKKQRRTAKY